MAPSPILLELGEYFGVTDSNVLLNLLTNIIFPFIVLGCVTGGTIQKRIGTSKMFMLTLILSGAGTLMNLVVGNSYALMLIGRSIFGLGYGFGVPFIGTAIMKWFRGHDREKMDTINGLFPFIGTMISFLFVPIISRVLGDWKWSLAIWGVLIFAVLIVWIVCIKEHELPDYTENEEETVEANVYGNLWKRKEIRLLCITFVCDFICYSYIAVILPTFLYEASNMSEATAGLWAAIAFPAVGIIGCSVGGIFMGKSGKRRPTLIAGQIFKFIGIMIATLGSGISVVVIIAGIALFGLGNGMWMPAMYCVPMELEDMNAARVGNAFALMTACAMTAGFLAPTIGGVLTDAFVAASGISDSVASHVFGLKWSLFIFGFSNLIGAGCMIKIRETGKQK